MKVKAINEVTLEFPSRSSNEGFARSAVACFAAQLDPTLNELEDIKTSVSEAVTNAIVHAYPDDLGKVLLKVRICPGNVLEITVRDHGLGGGRHELWYLRRPELCLGQQHPLFRSDSPGAASEKKDAQVHNLYRVHYPALWGRGF